MPENFSYPQVEDNSLVSPVRSISPMHTNPLNLPPSLPVDQTSLIVNHTLGFNTENDIHRIQSCVYPRVEDICTVEHRPNGNVAMEDVPVGYGIRESKDAIEIECAIWNASIGGCKDAHPTFHSTDDDEDEGGGEDQVDACMSNNLSFGGVGSAGAAYESDSNPRECSRQGNEEQHAEKEGDEVVNLLAHDIDPYEDAMRNNADGGFHTFLPLKPQSFDTNIPHNGVCIYFTYLFNLKSVLHLLVNMFCLTRLSVSVVFLIWIVSMTGIVFVRKM